jgi:hypothetical protein
MKKIEIIKNQKFGMLTVLEENPMVTLPSGQKVRSIRCKCECGTIKNIKLVHLTKNKIVSCGCKNKTKGGDGGTHLCKLWRSLKYRTSEKGIDKHRYFDRGIGVCEEWEKDYFKFKEWALLNGYSKELQIDRIDNNKGYSPHNCRFVTREENINNRENTFKVVYNDKTYALVELVRNLKIEDRYELIYNRIKRGWNHDKAINTPPKKGNYKRK